MKKLMALAFLATMTTTTTAAEDKWFQANKPVSCGPFSEIVKLVTGKDFQEQPLWIGVSPQDKTWIALFRNPNTTTWTLVQYGQEFGCVLGEGRGEKNYDYDSKKTPDSSKP